MARSRPILILGVLLLLTAGGSVLAMLFGSGDLPFSDRLSALFSPGGQSSAHTILWNLRLPRLLLGLLVGGGLASAGCVFQGMLRNPLADPYTLGVSGGAALGAALVNILGMGPDLGAFLIPTAAFAGALLSMLLVYLAASRRHFTPIALILGGIILNFFFASLVYLLFAFGRPGEIHATINWLMGDLGAAQPAVLLPGAVMILAGFAGFFFFSRDLNAMAMGDEKARNLGLDPASVRKVLFFFASVVTGAAVATAGIIGFVGLLIPHLLRPLTGPDHRILLPSCLLGGAAFLVLSDLCARFLPSFVSAGEFPVGVITGLAGGLFLLGLLFTGRISRFF